MRPKARSKALQASVGSQMLATVESIFAKMALGRREEEDASVVIRWMPIRRSRDVSGPKGKDKPSVLGANRDVS